MTDRKRLWLLGILVVVSLNLTVFIWKFLPRKDIPVPESVAASRRGEIDRLARARAMKAEWKQGSLQSIATFTSLHELASPTAQGECFKVPNEATRLALNDLPSAQQDDLDRAVSGLVKAYAADSPDAVLEYMAARGKRLSNDRMKQYRSLLVEADGLELSLVDSLSDEDVYRQSWTSSQARSHWQELVSGATCWSIWKSTAADLSELRNPMSLADELFEVFQKVRSWTHNFTSDAEDTVATPILVADFRLLIQHDSDLKGERAPYLVRFWYNPALDRWQPIVLARIATFPNAPMSIQF